MSDVSDLSQVVDDGVLSEAFQIMRSTGVFELGGWRTSITIVGGWGVVSVASMEDLQMIPEGDKVSGAMVFHTKSRIYETIRDENFNGIPPIGPSTEVDTGYGREPWGGSTWGSTGSGISASQGTQRVSDIMIWNGEQWRVVRVGPYPNRTFWKAIAVRIQGD